MFCHFKVFGGKQTFPSNCTTHKVKSFFLYAKGKWSIFKESTNYNKCFQTEKMSPITSHGERSVGGLLLFMCSRWTSIPIIQLRWTCPRFLNVCHQSVTVVISGNQYEPGRFKCDCEGGTSLCSITGGKSVVCFLSKSFLFFLIFPTSRYIGYLIQNKVRRGQPRAQGMRRNVKKSWGLKKHEF